MNSIRSFALFIITIGLSFITACGQKSAEKLTSAPELDFECSSVQAIGCDASQAGKPVFVGLTLDAEADCSSLFSGIVGWDQLALAFDYSSRTTTSDSGGILVGVATQWVNAQSMPEFYLRAKTYKACAFIDLNENAQIDLNEPIQDSNFTLGPPFLPLSSWSNY